VRIIAVRDRDMAAQKVEHARALQAAIDGLGVVDAGRRNARATRPCGRSVPTMRGVLMDNAAPRRPHPGFRGRRHAGTIRRLCLGKGATKVRRLPPAMGR